MINSSQAGNTKRAEGLKKMILNLANTARSELQRLRKLHKGEFVSWPSVGDLMNWQLWLQHAWMGGDDAQRVLFSTLAKEISRNDFQSWVFDGKRPYAVRPRWEIFALSLALAVSDLLPKMAFCANPGCPAPYFLKGRESQRFCDIPACATYGQREHKRKWWNEHGKQWKENRNAAGKPRRKHAKAKKA